MNKTRDEMVYDFMLALAANPDVHPDAILSLAESLADAYLNRGA